TSKFSGMKPSFHSKWAGRNGWPNGAANGISTSAIVCLSEWNLSHYPSLMNRAGSSLKRRLIMEIMSSSKRCPHDTDFHDVAKVRRRPDSSPLLIAVYHSIFGFRILSDVPDDLFKFFPDRSNRQCGHHGRI